MTTEIVTTPFEQIIESEDWEFACECNWHEPHGHTGPAEWIIHKKPACCQPKKVYLVCDACLQEILAFEGILWCTACGRRRWGVTRHEIMSYEPIRREP